MKLEPARTERRTPDANIPSDSTARHRVGARLLSAAWCAIVACASCAGVARAQLIRQDFYIADQSVNAAVVSGSTLYIGGQFTRVGPVTGGGASIDAATGALVAGFPKVLGAV